jgi:hypothetical protein
MFKAGSAKRPERDPLGLLSTCSDSPDSESRPTGKARLPQFLRNDFKRGFGLNTYRLGGVQQRAHRQPTWVCSFWCNAQE